MRDKASKPPRARRRLWVPPAPRWRAEPGTPDGLALLADFEGPAWRGREDLGVALYMAVRAVQLWTLTPSFGRVNLSDEPRTTAAERFAEARGEEPDLAPAWEAFALVVTAADMVDATALASACHDVYVWAEQRSLIRTAGKFAELAAFLEEESPAYANDAGWALRRSGLHDHAEMWHERAFARAVERRMRREVIRAQIGQATVQMDRGCTDAARVIFERAVRRALRTGKRRLAAYAQRYLFMLMAETGTLQEAAEDAIKALNLSPVFDPYLPQLTYNFAFLLIRHGQQSAALLLLQRLQEVEFSPHERLLLLGSLAWASGAAGRRDLYRDAERQLLELADVVEEEVPGAWLQLAQGANHISDWEGTRKYGIRGEQAARIMADSRLLADALALIRQAGAKRQPPRAASAFDSGILQFLINRFVARLRRWLAPRGNRLGANHPNIAAVERPALLQ